MTTAVLTIYASGGGYDRLAEIQAPSVDAFCKANGYDRIVRETIVKDRGPAWGKLPALFDTLAEYDDVLLLDADVIVMQPERAFPFAEMREHYKVMAVVEQKVPWAGEGFVPNTGVWGMNCAALDFLTEIWQWPDLHNGHYANQPWMEQSVYMILMGYTLTKPHPPLEHDKWEARRVFKLADEWNVSMDDHALLDTAIIRHASGQFITYDGRVALMEAWAAEAAL